MIWRNDSSRYGIPAKGFHWLSALIVLGLLLLGLYMTGLAPGPAKLGLYWWHKSFGTLLFFLVLARLLWRFANRQPDPVQGHKPWERFLAKTVHVLLYASMIGMPLSGLLMSAAGNFPQPFFGLFNMPDIIPGKNEVLLRTMREAHEITAFCLLAAIMLHGFGAFKHHFIDRDETLTRMLPGFAPKICSIVLVVLFGIFLCAAIILIASEEKPDSQRPVHVSAAAALPSTQNPSSSSVRPAGVIAPAWTILPEESTIGFTAIAQGQPFDGVFPHFNGTIFFDPDDLAHSHVTMRVAIAGVTTGSPERDDYIAAPAWLDASAFPQATLTTTEIRKTGDHEYTAAANLTLRDVTLPVDIPFRLTIADEGQDGRKALMEGNFTIHRLSFGIGANEWADTKTVSDIVEMKVHIAAYAKEQSAP